MWDFSMMTSSSEGAGIASLGSTHHLEISLAAMRPSCSREDRISSFMLQESQSPPEVSGMADSISEDRAEPSASSNLEAWRGDSGSMAASGVAVITSKISSEDEEDEASLWRKTSPATRIFRGGSSETMELLWQR
jgi:hypothetical protein